MTPGLLVPRLLRAIAIAIAIVAAFDPAITSNRSSRPDVAVIAVDPRRDSALAAVVTGFLRSSFAATPASFATADATVLVGDALPPGRSDLTSPVFAIMPDQTARRVTIEALRTPARVPLEARVPVGVVVHTTGSRNGEIALTLREFGVVVDRATSAIHSDDERTPLSLAFVPASSGEQSIQVTAELLANGVRSDSAHADALIETGDTLPVLFYDKRPSWPSTFVRRAAQMDSRLTVTSRTVTSRNVSTSTGKAPTDLDNLGSTDAYDAIVVGAPDGLTERDVAGLDSFMRRRGGTVVLLLDANVDGPWRRLAGAEKWLDNGSGRVVSIAREPGATSLKASELFWPAPLPPGAEPLAQSLPAAGDTAARHPVIWRSPVGSGQLIVSGALDSWRYRDSSVSEFDHFWRDLVVSAASAAVPPVAMTLSNTVVAPGEPVEVVVNIRNATLRALPVRATVTAAMTPFMDGTPIPVRLWPDGSPGVLRGTIRAPDTHGSFRIDVNADGIRAEKMLWVVPGTTHPYADGRDLLAAWTAAHGGAALPAARLAELPAALRRAIHPVARPERWHPMRSLWWLIPFVFALSGEWWWRRRRGLP